MATLRPPPFSSLFGEGFAGLELVRLAASWQSLGRLPRGSGRVLLGPGFSGDDYSMLPLRRFLRGLGYDARSWGLGRNRGDVPGLIDRLGDRIAATTDGSGAPVTLLGWSLGGYIAREAARERPAIAREAARERPAAVNRVITLGSPVIGGPRYTQLAPFYRLGGMDLTAVEAEIAARAEVPLEVPVHAVYSRRDGVVAWEACVDRREALAENIEVSATHFGLGVSAEVYRIIAERLARNGS